MIVHLVDGTYELFRHFYGLRRFTRVKGSASRGMDPPYGAVVGVLQTVLQMIENENGSAYLGVATDHVIASFRNRLWADYKTGAGIEPALRLTAFEPVRSDRKIPVKHSRQTARSRAALQGTSDPAHRCATLQEGRDAALARSDAGIRSLDRKNESAAVIRPRKRLRLTR